MPPTPACHVPYRVRQTQFLRLLRTSGPFTTHNHRNNDRGCKAVERVPSCKNPRRDSNVRRTVHPSASNTRCGEARGPTSITIIPRAKTSASGVPLSPLSRTSGAAHASVYPFTGVARTEFNPRTSEVSPKSVKRAWPSWSMRMLGQPNVISTLETTWRGHLPLSGLRVSYNLREGSPDPPPHPTTWENNVISQAVVQEGRLTRPIRSALGFSLTYFVRVPFGIYSETNCRGFVITPMKGTRFGCLSLFHMTASLRNDYSALSILEQREKPCRYEDEPA